MSRRNQSRRRRSYGRRQHEVRERRLVPESALDWTNDDARPEWLAPDGTDEPRDMDGAYRGYAR